MVVYYSSTGNTKEAAEYITSAKDGDLFELEPVNPYSDNESGLDIQQQPGKQRTGK